MKWSVQLLLLLRYLNTSLCTARGICHVVLRDDWVCVRFSVQLYAATASQPRRRPHRVVEVSRRGTHLRPNATFRFSAGYLIPGPPSPLSHECLKSASATFVGGSDT